MHACTILARNYLAHARVLARSFLAQHPGSSFHALILNPAPGPDGDEPFEVVKPDDLFSAEEWGPLWLAYSVLELATAVKPRLLRHLLERFGEGAVYLDADIRVYRPLAGLEGLLARHDVLLSPHTVHPLPRDGRNPGERDLLGAGIYNLGFIGVGGQARPFLDWWWERLERQCLVAPESQLFVDQRWMDFAPALFDCHLVKDPTVNVAYWNLGPRQLTLGDHGYLVNGEPLTFFHFSGYDPRQPWLLSRHGGEKPRVLMSESPALRRLCDEYAAELFDAGYAQVVQEPFDQHTLPDGTVLDERARRLYREAVVPVWPKSGLPDPPPDPLPNPLTDPAGLVAWLREPADPGDPPWLSRYLRALHRERPQLGEVFPEVPGRDESRFAVWVRRHGSVRAQVPPALLPPDEVEAPRSAAPRPVGEGVNLVGYLRAELGVGEHARQVAGAVAALGVPLATTTVSVTRSREGHDFPDVVPVPGVANPFDINLVCLNPPGLRQWAVAAGPEFFSGRYTVAYWAWELEDFPPKWAPVFDLVDEVWMNSRHAATGVAEHTDKPVEVFPVPVRAPAPAAVSRAELGMPDEFLFLFVFDYLSIFERKNPLGLLRAFRKAFRPGEGPVLVIKSINGELVPAKRERLRYEAKGRPDILLLEGYLPAGHKDALMAACDCYVSLHRAEGFGITMAEAMALGKPTVATGYSGNLEFMTRENSYLVGWSPGAVPVGCRPYREGARWAEPDLEEAAAVLRRVYENPEEARRMGEAARADLARLHSPAARTVLLQELLSRIRVERMKD